ALLFQRASARRNAQRAWRETGEFEKSRRRRSISSRRAEHFAQPATWAFKSTRAESPAASRSSASGEGHAEVTTRYRSLTTRVGSVTRFSWEPHARSADSLSPV